MKSQEIYNKIKYLFDRPWDEDLTDDEEKMLEEAAEALISSYGWETVYEAFTEYIFANCHSPEDAINIACCFWNYQWENEIVPNPYFLLSFLYYKIDLDEQKYDGPGILDSLAIEILPRAGIEKADLLKNPYYSPVLDEDLLCFVEKWRNGENLFASVE